VFCEILHPSRQWNFQGTSRNDASVVMRISHGNNTFLFTGDIGAKAKRSLLLRHPDIRATVLKASHHGAYDSEEARWISTVNPSMVVFSSGRGNRFGHPDKRTLHIVGNAGSCILRTDTSGCLTLVSDGSTIQLLMPCADNPAALLPAERGDRCLYTRSPSATPLPE
jgi:competence protein ComEC